MRCQTEHSLEHVRKAVQRGDLECICESCGQLSLNPSPFLSDCACMHCSPMRADNYSSLHDSQVMALRMHFNPMCADSHSSLLNGRVGALSMCFSPVCSGSQSSLFDSSAMALSMHFSPVYFHSQSSQQQEDMSEHDLASHRMCDDRVLNACEQWL